MRIAGLIAAIALCFFGAVFIYIAFFEKDIPKQNGLIAFLAGIGCLSLSTIIGLLVEILHNIKNQITT